MYEVFINEHLIILTNQITKEKDNKLFLLESVNIEEVIRQLQDGEIKSAHLYHKNEKELLPLLKKKLPLVVAAGGLVINPKEKLLFIFRNGKWDLPKGKLDKGESLEEAAVREVEEETGVNGLSLEKFLAKTYHLFRRNGTYKLKETYWYLMHTSYDGRLTPQCDEGIELVEWKKPGQIKEALKNSYQNIKVVINRYQDPVLQP